MQRGFFIGFILLLAFASVSRGESTANVAVPASQPASPTGDRQQTGAERTIGEFIGHFSAYEPTYFIAGPVDPVAKFQLSFKYRLFNEESPMAKNVPILGRLHFAYTQTSLWQLDKPSAPFFDTSYQPEFFYSNEDVKQFKIPGVSQFGLQTGYRHESNGESGDASRGYNSLFVRPIFAFGDTEKFHVTFAPRFLVYIGHLYGKNDLPDYRGYCDLKFTVGWRQGLELSTVGRVGKNFNRGSVQFDLTYPLRDLLNNNLDLYLDAQYFYGYGESLLEYNQRVSNFRIGFGLVR